MRTTVTIDDDVLMAARERAHRERRGIGAVLSDLARRGLDDSEPPPGESRNGFPVLPRRGGIVTNELIDQIRDDEGV